MDEAHAGPEAVHAKARLRGESRLLVGALKGERRHAQLTNVVKCPEPRKLRGDVVAVVERELLVLPWRPTERGVLDRRVR
jgi:hypothetical protein